MRLGIIDLGTNSVRFDAYEFDYDKGIKRLRREKLMVRLGEGVFLTGKLNREAVERTLDAFRGFIKTAAELQIEKIVAIATSALREAEDGEKLVAQIKKLTDIELTIISGETEAKYISRGILANEKGLKGSFALVDIGGGSTEVSICEGKEVQTSCSLPLGAARLSQQFPREGGATSSESMRLQVSKILKDSVLANIKPRPKRIIGSSGTIRALAKLQEAHGWPKEIISRNRLKKLIEEMKDLNSQQLRAFPGMDQNRIDIIVPGAILLEEIMRFLSVSKVHVTDFSLRDGLCREEYARFRKTSKPLRAFRLEDVSQSLGRFGAPTGYAEHMVESSKLFFNKFRNVHRLSSSWRDYFVAAALFRNIGKMIHPANHEEHAYYIVKHVDLPGFSAADREFVAQLCLRQNGWKTGVKNLLFCRNREEEVAFMKILALLRVASALETGTSRASSLKQVKTQNDKVKLTIGYSPRASLQLLHVEQRKGLFEQIFRRKLVVQLVPLLG